MEGALARADSPEAHRSMPVGKINSREQISLTLSEACLFLGTLALADVAPTHHSRSLWKMTSGKRIVLRLYAAAPFGKCAGANGES